jgi:signal transduction histidine kinase
MDGRNLLAVEGRYVVGALGAFYLAVAVGWAFTPLHLSSTFADDLITFVLMAGPGVVLLYGGYRLPRLDVRREFHATVAKWCVAGLLAMLCVLAFYSIQPRASVSYPSNIFILTGLSSVAGLAVGVHDAQAKTRTRELEETVEELETANERLEQFAYAASHDLQEPLRMVSSYLQLLESRYEDDLDEEAHEFIDYAVDGADRMRAMVESLLEYSRVTTRGGALEPTDAEAVLEDVLDDLQFRIEETDATVTYDDLPTVSADPEQLGRVFQNLVSNAIEYSGDAPPRVHVSAERTGEAWCFSVSDEGVGIDPAYHGRVFNVFEQLNASEDGIDPGAGGVGLALCERIVERHGGEIWVDSEPGDGATFYFTVPATGAGVSERPARRPVAE